MALSNAERQKKWRDANRALFNFRRRESRKKVAGVSHGAAAGSTPVDRSGPKEQGFDSPAPAHTSEVSGVTVSAGKFPRMVTLSSAGQPSAPVVGGRPLVYRDDYGRVISEAQWERLQKKKVEATEKNYEIDEWSQL